MGPGKRVIALAAAVGLVSAALAASAGGRTHRHRHARAHIACAKDATVCSESGNNTIPPGGSGSSSSDTVPTGSVDGLVTVEPFSSQDAAEFDQNWETIVAAYPKLGHVQNVFVRRVITCAVLARQVTDLYAALSKRANGTTSSADTSQLFLTICLRMVVVTQQTMPTHTVNASAAGCTSALVSIPIAVKRTGRTYTARFNATPKKAGRTPLVVSCQTQGTATLIGMHPRARKKKLYQVLDGHMGYGIWNPTTKSVPVHSVFSFK